MQSCSIHMEKRRYNPGYHVEVIKKHPTDVRPVVQKKETLHQEQNLRSEIVTKNDTQPILPEQENESVETKELIPFHLTKRGGDECDIAYLKNGKTIKCTYIQITDVIFTYKICGGKTTDVKSIDMRKIDFIVLNKGDTIYPENKAYEWKKEHGETDAKTRKQLLKRGGGASKVGTSVLYAIFGILAIGAGVPLLFWAITNLGLWIFVGGFFLIILAVAMIIGGVALIILSIINAIRR